MGFAVQTVAGDARFIADNGPARADKAIEQGGFADIGPADDGDKRNFVHLEISSSMARPGESGRPSYMVCADA
jgi:hypothetical protein